MKLKSEVMAAEALLLMSETACDIGTQTNL